MQYWSYSIFLFICVYIIIIINCKTVSLNIWQYELLPWIFYHILDWIRESWFIVKCVVDKQKQKIKISFLNNYFYTVIWQNITFSKCFISLQRLLHKFQNFNSYKIILQSPGEKLCVWNFKPITFYKDVELSGI